MAKKKASAIQPINIKVIGTGGIGLCLLPTLCRYLNFKEKDFPQVDITLIDGDIFEEKNRDRQEFTDLGPKATVTANELREKFPRIAFWDEPQYITEDNIQQLIREDDIVLLCVDNHATRHIVSQQAEQLDNVTIINGGNDLEDGNVLVHIRREKQNITEPLANKYHPEILYPNDENPADIEKKPAGCQEMVASAPQLVITNNYIAANMLAIFYDLTNPDIYARILKEPENYGEVYCDLRTVKSIPRPRKVSKSK